MFIRLGVLSHLSHIRTNATKQVKTETIYARNNPSSEATIVAQGWKIVGNE